MRDKPDDMSEVEVHVLWINAGLSCDGDSVALTSATQPSIEDLAPGVLPGLPKVHFHWPLIDYENGPVGVQDDFIHWFHEADAGELDAPFVLVVEGSIPNEKINGEGYWAAFGNDPLTGEPRTTSEWVERLAPKALAVVAAGTCATYGGIHAMEGNPTGAMGVADLLGWDFRTPAGIPIVNVPGCPIHPDNLSETFLYLLYQATGQAPMIPLDEKLRPTWLLGATVHDCCCPTGCAWSTTASAASTSPASCSTATTPWCSLTRSPATARPGTCTSSRWTPAGSTTRSLTRTAWTRRRSSPASARPAASRPQACSSAASRPISAKASACPRQWPRPSTSPCRPLWRP
jgi:Ni,Fe-hydrogenase I small subunit